MAQRAATRTVARGAPRRTPLVPPSSGGASAGLRGGALTAALLVARYGLAAQGAWLPMKAMAALWLGPAALLGGWETAALGVLTHLAGAAAGGGVFASLIGRRTRTPAALALGLAYGAALYALSRFLALPALDRTLWIRVNLSPGWWLFVYLAYGACLGLVPSLRRRGAAELVAGEDVEQPRTFY